MGRPIENNRARQFVRHPPGQAYRHTSKYRMKCLARFGSSVAVIGRYRQFGLESSGIRKGVFFRFNYVVQWVTTERADCSDLSTLARHLWGPPRIHAELAAEAFMSGANARPGPDLVGRNLSTTAPKGFTSRRDNVHPHLDRVRLPSRCARRR
jgi:hypothetical protein